MSRFRSIFNVMNLYHIWLIVVVRYKKVRKHPYRLLPEHITSKKAHLELVESMLYGEFPTLLAAQERLRASNAQCEF
jgi:hypothetical protein